MVLRSTQSGSREMSLSKRGLQEELSEDASHKRGGGEGLESVLQSRSHCGQQGTGTVICREGSTLREGRGRETGLVDG